MPWCVIGWRPFGQTPWFFRGGGESQLYLPLITDRLVEVVSSPNARGIARTECNGWVTHVESARVFDVPVCFDTRRSFHPTLDLERLNVFPYVGDLLPTQIYRPLRPRLRPR